MINKNSTFEYTNKDSKMSPFQVFCKYSDEKDKCATGTAVIVNSKKIKIDSILDVGSGDGSLLLSIIQQLDFKPKTIDILEPSKDLLQVAISSFRDFEGIKFIENKFEDWESQSTYDIVLASHLYHITKENMESQYIKLISKVKVGGSLIFIMRTDDDIYRFKSIFKKKILGDMYAAQTIQDAHAVFLSFVPEKDIKLSNLYSTLSIPLEKSTEDREQILSFLLNSKFEELGADIKLEVLDYVKNVDGVFNIVEGIMVIDK